MTSEVAISTSLILVALRTSINESRQIIRRSHFYIENETIELFNIHLHGGLSDAALFEIVSRANEFTQVCSPFIHLLFDNKVKVREDEMNELVEIEDEVPLPIRGGVEGDEGFGKVFISGIQREFLICFQVNALLQAFIGGTRIRSFSLVSDMNYVAQVQFSSINQLLMF